MPRCNFAVLSRHSLEEKPFKARLTFKFSFILLRKTTVGLCHTWCVNHLQLMLATCKRMWFQSKQTRQRVVRWGPQQRLIRHRRCCALQRSRLMNLHVFNPSGTQLGEPLSQLMDDQCAWQFRSKSKMRACVWSAIHFRDKHDVVGWYCKTKTPLLE